MNKTFCLYVILEPVTHYFINRIAIEIGIIYTIWLILATDLKQMRDKNPFEKKVGQLIIDCLNLEEIHLDDIDPDGRLFGEGLGLDSIDALELSMAVSNQYGVQIKSDDAKNEQIFASLASLADYIEANRSAT